MIVWCKALSIWHRLSLLGIAMLVCLLGVHIAIWQPMGQSIEVLQQEVTRLDQESQGLTQKIGSLKSVERDITELRENLSSRVQQFPEYVESKTFRRDVMDIAKRRSVTVRVWKPEAPLMGLQHSETSIPITVRVEGAFQGTVQFLDELRQLSWVQSMDSIVMTRKQGSEDSSLVITNIAIHGLTPLGIEHVQKLLKA
jgi:Tfp pilus assembly protein PilO